MRTLLLTTFALTSASAFAADAIVIGTCGVGPGTYTTEVQTSLHLSGYFNRVEAWDGTAGIPAPADLRNYDVAILQGDCGYSDGISLGNNLASYVDNGGGVVLPPFDWAVPYISGDFQAQGYFPLGLGSPYGQDDRQLGQFDAQHPIMRGVRTYQSGYFNVIGPTVTRGANTVAAYTDGDPLVVEYTPSNAGIVIAVNDYVVSSMIGRADFYDHGKGASLWANVSAYAAGVATSALFGTANVGTCPGPMDIEVVAATPNGVVALMTGTNGGITNIPRGACAGTSVPLSAAQLRGTVRADAAGRVTLPLRNFGLCGAAYAALDMGSCQVATDTID